MSEYIPIPKLRMESTSFGRVVLISQPFEDDSEATIALKNYETLKDSYDIILSDNTNMRKTIEMLERNLQKQKCLNYNNHMM